MIETLHKRLRDVVCVLISSRRDVLYFEISIKCFDSKIRLIQMGLIQKMGLIFEPCLFFDAEIPIIICN